MQSNEAVKPIIIRLAIPRIISAGQSDIPQHVDIHRTKNEYCKPKEIWGMFNNTKEDLGKKSHKHVKRTLIKQLTDNDDDNKPLSPASFKTMCKNINSRKDALEDDWGSHR